MSYPLLQVKLQGYRSCILGIPVNDNWHTPWPKSKEFTAWIEGWDLAHRDAQSIVTNDTQK